MPSGSCLRLAAESHSKSKVLRPLLERRRVATVPHRFRSSFLDWAAEETEHRREIIEAALAHVVGNKVEATYARSDLFEGRLMNDWAAYLADTYRPHSPIAEPAEQESPEAQHRGQ